MHTHKHPAATLRMRGVCLPTPQVGSSLAYYPVPWSACCRLNPSLPKELVQHIRSRPPPPTMQQVGEPVRARAGVRPPLPVWLGTPEAMHVLRTPEVMHTGRMTT